MVFQADAVQVLIASPSDTQAEREVLRDVIADWNALNAAAYETVLLPVMWETHATPEMGDRPQAIINRQIVDDTDILLGTFWTRLGTPTGEAVSGTVEEITRFVEAEKPTMIYFSSVPVSVANLDPKQLESLRAFQKELINKGLQDGYETLEDLRRKVTSHLTRVVRDHFARKAAVAEETSSVAGIPSTELAEYEKQLRFLYTKYESSWAVEKGGQDVDAWRFLMSDLSAALSDFRARLLAGGLVADEPLSGALQAVAETARELSRHRFFLDGGQSMRTFQAGADSVISELKRILTGLWPSPS
jgi:hypothetical protein